MYDAKGFKLCMFIVCCLMAAYSFSFIDLQAFPKNSVGAMAFYA